MSRRIHCPLYGNIELTELACSILNTREMQRLRDIKQLGATYYVFPSANHTRLEHSLGVYHLAGIMARNLQKTHPEANITDRDIELIQIAGLIHDIGHGPFSHLYDHYIKSWGSAEHEERGLRMFETIVEREKIQLSGKEITEIQKMIEPGKKEMYNWKYQIIANKSCQIDVDKIDYILRDSFHLGIPHSGEFKKLLEDVRLNMTPNNNVELVWDSKLQFDIYSLFSTRYRLHKKVYTHHTVKGFEYIIIEIMKLLKSDYSKTKTPLYMRTDSVVTEFCYNNPNHKLAYALLNRKHPILVGEVVLKDKEDVQKSKHYELHADKSLEGMRIIIDLIVEELKIGFVSGNDKNPLTNVYYYSKGKEHEEPFKIDLSDSSFIIPEKFQERILRLYRYHNSSHKEALTYWEEIKK
jgi:HD superfamily phosphohydrolase